MALVNTSDTKVAEYSYDAWGNALTKTGSLASTLGTVQPFRYRGYVYDEETELYYLRSRYYKPQWNRFLNADALVKGNLYCYTGKNLINKVDQAGKDAIWIQERYSANNAGHSGLLVQDEQGVWYYFYWGRDINHLSNNPFANTPANVYLEPIGLCSDLDSVDKVQNFIKTVDTEAYKRADLITDIYYFEGDYTNTYQMVEALNNSKDPLEYNILTRNCVQVVLDAFIASDRRFNLCINSLSSSVIPIPNVIASKVALLPWKKGKYPWLLILEMICHETPM